LIFFPNIYEYIEWKMGEEIQGLDPGFLKLRNNPGLP
jgi:hypothetical protein